jgi:hypothetical protein
MTYGCDHGGRGGDVVEFGDYWRTQRWNQGPGSDQPGLGKNIMKAKVASSLAHLNERPRVWLEGYYGSGWGTSSEQITDVTFADFLLGYNLLSLHGLYYTTHGGWWEWAPPCNHFRMPYWKHFKTFMDAEQRLAYLMTQGVHVCDVAVWYPVAPSQAGIDGAVSKNLSFQTVSDLYKNGIDADFIDFQSIEKAEIKNGRLHLAGEAYRVLVLPHPKALRHGMLRKAVEFAEAGGIVITLGAFPEYTDRQGANDPEVKALAKRLPSKYHFAGTREAVAAIQNAFAQDIIVTTNAGGNTKKKWDKLFYFAHRKIADKDFYGLYNLPKNAELTLRATGSAELWDVWTGKRRALPVIAQKDGKTTLRLENTPSDLVLILFSQGKPAFASQTPPPPEQTRELSGKWNIEYIPTMDNSFGDFRWPGKKGQIIGPEARAFEWKTQGRDWTKTTSGFGPKFRQLTVPGTLSAKQTEALEKTLCQTTQAPAAAPWKDYDFSWRSGVEGDPGHQGWHGLKENMYDTFIRLGKFERLGHLNSARKAEKKERSRYYLWSTVLVPKGETAGVILTHGLKPSKAWLNGKAIDLTKPVVALREGANPVLLRYDSHGAGYFVVVSPTSQFAEEAIGKNSAKETLHDDSVWIWNAPGTGAGRAAFRKTFFFNPKTDGAGNATKTPVFIATGDDKFRVELNGKILGNGGSWQNLNIFELKNLKEGKNVLAVLAENGDGPRGFIGEVRFANGKRIATDKSWLTGNETGEWQSPTFDDSSWTAATELEKFAGSLWAAHPQGPPSIRNFALDNIQHETTGPLAMRWFDVEKNALKTGVFPFDIYAGKTVKSEYRFAVPPAVNSTGTKTVFASGGEYGGAVFDEPLAFALTQGEMALGDWSKVPGLETYSGGVKYSQTLALEALPKSAVLDLGRVVASAEVFVNGKSAGVRVAAPWKFDIAPFLKNGENKIGIEVYNTLGNHYQTIPTMYRGRTESGLIGPVRLLTR